MIWRDEYKIGVDLVDEQHKELFNRLGDFIQTVRSAEKVAAKKAEIDRTLAFLGDYVVTHFNAEEALQKKYNYPDFENHHEVHEQFKSEIAEFKKEFESSGYDEDLLMEFSGYLLTWLINHVAATDQKIGDYINSLNEEDTK